MPNISLLFSSHSHSRKAHRPKAVSAKFHADNHLPVTYPPIPTQHQTVKMMKIIIAALALAATAFGAPADGLQRRQACTPATYSCTPDTTGWQVCDVTGVWDVSKPSAFLTLLPRRLGQNANSSPTTVRRLLPTRHRLRFLPAQPLAILCASRLCHSVINGFIHSSSFGRA
jgi:hypothetical protein